MKETHWLITQSVLNAILEGKEITRERRGIKGTIRPYIRHGINCAL